MSDHGTDRALIEGVCRGCPDAADAFCRRYRPLIAGLAVNRFDFAPDEADDLVNQILLQLWDKDFKVLRAWRGKARFSSYLGAIVIHACQRARAETGRTRALDQDALSRREDTGPGPDEMAERSQEYARIARATHALSDRDRLLLALRFGDECSPAEIARLLNLNPGTVRKALFDALQRLRSRLPADGGDASEQYM